MSAVLSVTVLIPARNEEADIERCLQAVLAQDHPHDRLEVIVVDGGSTDATAAIAKSVLSTSDVDWTIVDNPAGTTPSNLNAGLRAASGDLLCRVDARSLVPSDYVRLCAEVLTGRSDVAVTGGAQVAVAVADTALSVGIARALNNRYAMGGSRYRSGATSGPSDTVYLGAFRTAEVRELGGWDEYFETNQDYELNRRMGRHGTVWFDDRIEVGYVPRQSLGALWRQYHRFGRWKVRYWRHSNDRPQCRQRLPLAVLPVLVGAALTAAARGRTRVVVVSTALGLVVLDGAGSRERSTPAVRIVGAAAIVVVIGGWVSGVYAAIIEDRRSPTSDLC